MSGFKGTPGPWVVSANSPFLVRAGDDTTGRHIAHVGPASYHPSFEVDEPNARLIAAAPDLLEALSTLLNMDVKGHRLGDRLQFSTPGRKILDKCNSAIAKALGEDQ